MVARNHELSGDRLIAEDELGRKMGTLRYLRQLRLARRAHAGALRQVYMQAAGGAAGCMRGVRVCVLVSGGGAEYVFLQHQCCAPLRTAACRLQAPIGLLFPGVPGRGGAGSRGWAPHLRLPNWLPHR